MMQKKNAILLAAAGVISAVAPAHAEKIVSYFNPVPQASVPLEAAMRPPAPAFDPAVPYPQQMQIQQQIQNQYQPPMPAAPQYPGLGANYAPQPVGAVKWRPKVEVEEDDNGRSSPIAGKISGSAGFTTDYVFRGISQTQEDPAVQAGFEYQHYLGLYAGVWGSNVNFGNGDNAKVEIDGYGGYRTEVAENLSMDIGAVYYGYPGVSANLDYGYWEVYLSGEYGIPIGSSGPFGLGIESVPLGASLSYSPDFFAASGNAYYLKGTGAVPFENGVTLDAHVGKQWIEDNAKYGFPDYMDWSVGLGYSFMDGYEVKVQYTDTNVDEADCTDICSARAVASVSKSFE